MERILKTPVILATLIIVGLLLMACAPGAAPTPTPTKAPAAAATQAPETKPTAAPAPSPTTPPKALAPYKIGVVVALSGYYTALGVPIRDGAVAAANEINASGGINGRRVELVILDDGTDETKGVLAAKKLINDDKVVAAHGPTGTGLSMAAIPVYQEGETPHIAISAADIIVDPVKKWTFKFIPGENKIIPELYAYLKSKGVKKLAVFYPATALGKEALARYQSSASKEGFELAAVETYDPNDKDFAPQLTKIKASGAQGLIVHDASIATALIAKQMKSMGINLPWTAPFGILGPANLQAAGDAFDGLTVPAPKIFVAEQMLDNDPQKKVAVQYKEAFRKNTGKDADPNAFFGWDAVMVIAEAIKRTNADPDKLAEARAKIRDGIEGLRNYTAVVSSLSLSPTDHEGMPAGWSALVEVRGGKFIMLK